MTVADAVATADRQPAPGLRGDQVPGAAVRPTIVPRTRLVERLIAADPQSVTTIVGSPGMGKSSVLAEWFQQTNDGSIAWLSADRNDADPVRFWRALINSIQLVEPTFGVDAADVITLDGAVTPDVLESVLADDHSRAASPRASCHRRFPPRLAGCRATDCSTCSSAGSPTSGS